MEKKSKRKVKVAVIGAVVMCAIVASCRYMVGRFDVRYIVSGSMLPVLKIGAVCVIDRTAKHPKKGQIACYVRDGDSLLVTHRVQESGKSYTFRGDANRDSDLPVSQSQIYGTVVFHTNAAAGVIGKKVAGRTDKAIVKNQKGKLHIKSVN